MIIGGAQIYQSALQTKIGSTHLVQKIYMSIMEDECECDTFFDNKWLKDFVITSENNYNGFTHYILERTDHGEHQYLELMENILLNGTWKIGRNGLTIGSFKNDFTFNLQNGFPLLTTKKMFLRGIVEEFLFFINGKTDSTILSEKNVKIWEGNTTKEFIESRDLNYAQGVMGPMYGYQWRFYNAPYKVDENGRPLPSEGGVDQLSNVVELIKNDPNSRRILLTSYNPCQAEEGVLYPCHSITIQFYVEKEYLDMFCYNRSQDLALGIPFNIASSSLLLTLVAKLSCKHPRFLHMTMGDTHIYESHASNVSVQLDRRPYKFPTLSIPDLNELEEVEQLSASDFILSNYVCHPSIKIAMVT